MLTLALIAFAVAGPAAADPPPPAAASPSPAAMAATSAAPAATPVSVEAMASDPRMIAAIRHANAVADKKCGVGIGGVVDIAARAEAQRCRRRIVTTAKLDAEGEIEGH